MKNSSQPHCNIETIADIQGLTKSAPDRIFHASLPLYILLEKRPKLGRPNWVEVGCWKEKGGAEGVMVYLTLIDAMLDLNVRNRAGGKYRIFPFESIDPRPYIQEKNDWFSVYLVYGFAACDNRLIVSKRGEIISLAHATHFHITPNMANHFHLSFADKMLEWLSLLHIKAQIPDYARIAKELTESSPTEINRMAHAAMQHVESPVLGDEAEQCALYDPIEQQWRFVAFADLRN